MLNPKHKNVKKRSSHYVLFQFAVPKKTQMYQNPSQQGPGKGPIRSPGWKWGNGPWVYEERTPHGWDSVSASSCSDLCFCLHIQDFFFFQIGIILQNISSTLLIFNRDILSDFPVAHVGIHERVGCYLHPEHHEWSCKMFSK